MRIDIKLAWPSVWVVLATPVSLAVVYAIVSILRRLHAYRTWLTDVRGPANPSFQFGSYADYYRYDMNDVNCRWIDSYGGALRFWAFFGEPLLMLTDPVGIEHVLVKQWQAYEKHPDFIRFADCIMGIGLLASEGPQYKRQKFAIQRGFTPASVKAYYPIFVRHSRHLCHKLLTRVERHSGADGNENGVLTDILKPSARTTLDILSDAGFGEPFGALRLSRETFGQARAKYDPKQSTQDDNDEEHQPSDEHPLAQAYDALITAATVEAGKQRRIMFDVASWFLPELLWLPFKLSDNRRIKQAKAVVYEQASKVIRQARQREQMRDEQMHLEGAYSAETSAVRRHGSVIEMLVRAQLQGEEMPLSPTTCSTGRIRLADKAKLTEDDVVNQVTTLMLAGHETTSSTLAWLILSMARNPSVQRKLRNAIREKRIGLGLSPSPAPWTLAEDIIGAHIDEPEPDMSDARRDLTMEELEEIEYLDHCVQEALRLFGPVHTSSRVPLRDDVIPIDPLISPNAPADGIRVRKGTSVVIPIEAMNHSASLWGKDAQQFVPERWTRPDLPFNKRFPSRTGGASFFFGPRSCIGSRFATLELKAILVALISELAFDDCKHKIIKARWIVIRPYDLNARCEQCPVRLRKVTEADWIEP